MTLKTLKKGDLTLILDIDFLNYKKKEILELTESESFEEFTDKKNKPIDKDEYQNKVERLCKLATDIIDEKLGIDIFSYLPLTKAGKFHKTKSIFLATSGIKDVFNGDYFKMEVLDLRITPVSYAEKINPFIAIDKTGDIFGTITGDGNVGFLELNWYPHQNKENPIFDENNNPIKQITTRNKYLKEKDLKPGYSYLDAKGNEFLYLGHFCEKQHENMGLDTKEKYLKSEEYEEFKKWYKNCELHIGNFIFAKITKKLQKEIDEAKNIDELLKNLVKKEGWYWYKGLKTLEHPLKVVKENEKILDDDSFDGYYYFEIAALGSTYKGFYYFEKN